ncbi:TPA: hypothetical protein ACNUWH_002582 [Aeromonas salmonicida subsp. salmonicida]|uniref:hypothetical protein n=1 Tax=Aeromonas salmonicida TaxID=645 RepID=UPI001F30D7D1|nr:hypothetical protein [Aeromonas salmonicida]
MQDAIQHWELHHPKEVTARGARLTELKQALAEQGIITRAAPRHEPKVMAGGTQALLQKSMAGLEKLGSYACTDAQTFVQPNNPSYQKIIDKLNAFGQVPQRLAANQRANNSDQRIEVLAHRGAQGHAQTHCFVVIGRAEGSELTKPESWGQHAKVVDPWAATIGAPLVGTPARPPIANLWPPTESVFDNTHRED